MRQLWFSLVLAAFLVVLPLSAGALGLDVEAKVGGGLALGSTNNPDEGGSPRAGFLGGVGVDVYLLKAGPVDLGVSVGAEYDYLMFHGTYNNFAFPGETQTSDSTYNYLYFPISLVGRVPLTQSLDLTLRAGAFIGHFLGGSANLTYSTEVPPNLVNGTQTLNSSTTLVGEYGLHFTGGLDIALSKSLALSPGVQFDMGLTNTNAVSPTGGAYTYSDTFWAITATFGIKYNVF
jgi:hypothetical protein